MFSAGVCVCVCVCVRAVVRARGTWHFLACPAPCTMPHLFMLYNTEFTNTNRRRACAAGARAAVRPRPSRSGCVRGFTARWCSQV
jgi:hypothetical protein